MFTITDALNDLDLDFDFVPPCEALGGKIDPISKVYNDNMRGLNVCDGKTPAEYRIVTCCVTKLFCQSCLDLKLSLQGVTCTVCLTAYKPPSTCYKLIERLR